MGVASCVSCSAQVSHTHKATCRWARQCPRWCACPGMGLARYLRRRGQQHPCARAFWRNEPPLLPPTPRLTRPCREPVSRHREYQHGRPTPIGKLGNHSTCHGRRRPWPRRTWLLAGTGFDGAPPYDQAPLEKVTHTPIRAGRGSPQKLQRAARGAADRDDQRRTQGKTTVPRCMQRGCCQRPSSHYARHSLIPLSRQLPRPPSIAGFGDGRPLVACGASLPSPRGQAF